jgi:hypothetical protein
MTKKVALAKEIQALEKDRRTKEREMRTLKASLDTVTYQRDKLISRMSNMDDGLPILQHTVTDPETYKCEKETFFEDPRDEILNDWDEEEHGLYAGCPGYSYAHFSVSAKPTDIVAEGKVKFVREGYNQYDELVVFESRVVESPNYAEALMYFFKSMNKLDDFHHVFMEGAYVASTDTDGVKIVEFAYGS